MTYCWAGEADRVLEEFEKILENREAMLLLLYIEPAFDKMRSDPRVIEFFERLQFIGLKSQEPRHGEQGE